MQEKNVTIEDAFQIWWFIFWRTLLTAIGAGIVSSLILVLFTKAIGATAGLQPLANAACIILSVVLQVFYIKLALNRNYKNFRLSALNTEQQKYGE